MAADYDWRDAFCGRERELEALVSRFEEVAAGRGPRLAVVLGDRGMGKTRLVQELYRVLSTRFDPHDYWPHASLFAGNNLRVSPDLSDLMVRSHYESFKLIDRPMSFLWWGFRLSDPDVRNAARSDMATHRATLDPHLEPVRFARQIGAARARMRMAGVDASSELGKNLIKAAVQSIPGVGAVATVLDLVLDFAGKGKQAAEAARDELSLRKAHRALNLLESQTEPSKDINQRTLDDLAAMLAPDKCTTPLPVIVFCDDAQFAREAGDEGAMQFLITLWQRAHLADWPLLLILTHWGFEWRQGSEGSHSCAGLLSRDARSPQLATLIDLPKESALTGLVTAGLPGLPAQDVTLLLEKADGNPQVLIELVELVRRAPAWRRPGSGELTPHARQEIERRVTRLAELILERLESDATPESVRQAVALSSVQGMEFLGLLTESAARAFGLSETAAGLKNAQRPHRLVVAVEDGVAAFVQRAYRDAAANLIGGHVGDLRDVERELMNAAIALVDNSDRWGGLSLHEQTAVWGALIALAEEHADAQVRRYAGLGLLRLAAAALNGQLGPDFARAAELAQRFEAGLASRWMAEDFTVSQMDVTRQAITVWHGPVRSEKMARVLLQRANDLAAKLGTPEAQRDVSVALGNVGDVAQAQGDWATAGAMYCEGLAIARDLAAKLGTPEALRDVSISLIRVGDVAQARADWTTAGERYRESLLIARDLAAKLGTPEAQRDVSVPLERVGDVAQAQGDWSTAGATYREGLAIARELAAKLGTPEALRDLSVLLQRVGDLVQANGDWITAGEQYSESLDIARALAAKLGTPDAQRDVSVALEKVGDVAQAQGDWATAGAMYREGYAIAHDLAAKLGTPEALRGVSMSVTRLGDVAQAQGDWTTAGERYRESLLIARDLAAKLGTPEAQRGVSVPLERVGDVAQAQGDWATAGAMYREGLANARDLAAKHCTPKALHDVSRSLIRVGDVAQAQDDWTTAGERYRESLFIARGLVEKLGTPEAQRGVSVSLDKVGDAAQAQGDWATAGELYRESLLIARDLAAKLGTSRSLRDVSVSLNRMGEVAQARGDWVSAGEMYREGLTISRDLAAKLGTPQAQQGVSVSLDKVGDVAQVQGDLTSAGEMYRESLAIARNLTAKLGTTEAQRDLAVSLIKLASVARKQGNESESCQLQCEAQRILETLSLSLKTPQASAEARDVANLIAEQGCRC